MRASTAASTYFAPERLQWDSNDPDKQFYFEDGGVTPYNNPSFIMFQMATAPEYKCGWSTGEDRMMIISVGTSYNYRLLPSPHVGWREPITNGGDLHVANSIKNLLATSFTTLSILVFGIGGLIVWSEALTMMLGSTVGGYIGGRYAKKGQFSDFALDGHCFWHLVVRGLFCKDLWVSVVFCGSRHSTVILDDHFVPDADFSAVAAFRPSN